MPEYKSACARITVDGVRLPEYDTQVSDDGVITCWIPCEAGKNFQVHWIRNAKESATRGKVLVDGTVIATMVTPPNDTVPTLVKGKRTSLTTRRLLQFATMTLTDDASFLNQSISPHLGEINVLLVRGLVKSSQRKLRTAPSGHGMPDITMHESVKKGIVHRCKLGDEVEEKQRKYTAYYLHETSPYCSFVFKYRSLDWLIAQGIAPSPVSANNDLMQEDPIEVSDDEDARREEEEMLRLKTRLEELEKKQQKRSKSGAVKMEVKSEVKSEVPNLAMPVVIDLT